MRSRLLSAITFLLAVTIGFTVYTIDKSPERIVVDEYPAVEPPVLVAKVIDGDTFVVYYQGVERTVRVLGIDAPETTYSPQGAECYNEEATAAARTFLTDQAVVLETDSTQGVYDDYGRLLAYVSVNDREDDFGAYMLEHGYAKEYTFIQPYERQAAYRQVAGEAQAAGVGLWGECE